MNNIYIYNNFYELLKLINILIEHNIKPYNIKEKMYNPTLFDNIIKLDLSDNKDIINCCIKSIGINNFNIIYKVSLSSENNKELIIYYYYLNSLKYKENTMYMRNLKCVSEALRINKYVGYVNYQYDKDEDIYNCGILIEDKYRGKGYSKPALKLLIKEANKNIVSYNDDTDSH